MVLRPPPERDYASLEKLIEAVRKHAEKEGYAISTKRSKSSFSTGEKIKCVLVCDREGFTKRKPGAKLRKNGQPRREGSRKCGCNFKVNGIYDKHLNAWLVKVIEDKHNHEPVEEEGLGSIASVRKQEKDEDFYERVATATKEGEYVYPIIAGNDH